MIDTTAIGQAVLAAIVVAGYVAAHFSQKKKFDQAERSAGEIYVRVDGRLEKALTKIDELEKDLVQANARIDAALGFREVPKA
jgi:hypothetical protein